MTTVQLIQHWVKAFSKAVIDAMEAMYLTDAMDH